MKLNLHAHVVTVFCLMTTPLWGAVSNSDRANKAKELKEFLEKDRKEFHHREFQKRNILEELDQLNAEQNQLRQKLADITTSQQELRMSLDNLSLEYQNQKKIENLEKQQMLWLLKVVYKIKTEGILRFTVEGGQISDLLAHVRILYRTFHSHSKLAKQLSERSHHLKLSHEKLNKANADMEAMLSELRKHEAVLNEYLGKKHKVLKSINQKQAYHQVVAKEYKNISTKLNELFDNLRSPQDETLSQLLEKGSLAPPVNIGHIVKNFGRSIHEKFGTVIYQKGIEIEATHQAPVSAVMAGVVEYEGWVKGLGNVVILSHGGGLHSLSAHLFRSMKEKGSKVEQGETIGLVGDTGSSERPSLYFELRENGKAINPLTYFSNSSLRTLQ